MSIFAVGQKDGKKVNRMAEFIVKETGFPGAIKQEVVGELIRCKDCKWRDITSPASTMTQTFYKCRCFEKLYTQQDDFCSRAERRE